MVLAEGKRLLKYLADIYYDFWSAVLVLRVYAIGGRGRRLKAYLIVHFVVRIAVSIFLHNLELTVHRLSS